MKTATQLAIAAGIHALNHLHALELVARHGPLAMTTLADLVGVSTAAITGAVDLLESVKLVERTPVPGDRRKHNIALTKLGKALVREMAAANEAEVTAAREAAAAAEAVADASLALATSAA